MGIAKANVVFEHGFDAETIAEIETIRSVRLVYAEKMLKNLDTTMRDLQKRGAVDETGRAFSADLVRQELTDRVATLRQRLEQKDVIFADEIELYVDILKGKE